MWSQKITNLAVLTWFAIRGKIQDGDHCWWRHRPPAAPQPIKYTSLFREDQRLSTEGKSFSKYCNISTKTLRGEGGHQQTNSPPPLLYHGWGLTLHVCPRVKSDSLSSWNMTLEFFWTTGFPPFLSRRCDRHKLNFDWANGTFALLSHDLVVFISCGLCWCLYFW